MLSRRVEQPKQCLDAVVATLAANLSAVGLKSGAIVATLNALTTEKPFSETKILEYNIGRGFGALERSTPSLPQSVQGLYRTRATVGVALF